MTIIKALLVGVPENTNNPMLAMPSAVRDVARMYDLVNRLPNPAPGSSCVRLPDPNNTTDSVVKQTCKANILHHLKNFLFANPQPGSRLLFYFSGHGMLFADPLDVRHADELLCPSDGWAEKPGARQSNLDGDEFVSLALPAFNAGACIEVVIEACSAAGWIPPGTNVLYPFGYYFGGTSFPGGSGAVWSASLIGENSHSGPVPDCKGTDRGGLFTYYFHQYYAPGKTRATLLDEIKAGLAGYAAKCNSDPDCCKDSPDAMGPQSPRLFCSVTSTVAQPMAGGTCQLAPLATGPDAVATNVSGAVNSLLGTVTGQIAAFTRKSRVLPVPYT